jgi:ABC-type proline/glycine betaine transport system ATPase subunit
MSSAAMKLLKTVGLQDFSDKFPWQLSGGMQQRSNLCRALMHEPEILMLDEPFGALDAFTREELWGVMQALWLEKRFTGVLVTHDLREAVYLADTVYVMSRRPGRIVKAKKIDMPRPRTLATTFDRTSSTSSTTCATASIGACAMSEPSERGAEVAMPWLVLAGPADRLGARLHRLQRSGNHLARGRQESSRSSSSASTS